MDKKTQIPFRFNDATASLIDKGLSIYKNESNTDKISRNQLLEICIKKSVIDFPDQVKNLNKEIRDLKNEVLRIKELIKMKSNIDQELARMV